MLIAVKEKAAWGIVGYTKGVGWGAGQREEDWDIMHKLCVQRTEAARSAFILYFV